MAIERTELEESREKDEAVKAEEQRQAELEAAREEARQAKIQAAKAEGAAEALKLGLNKPQETTPVWTDDQWENEAQKYGKTGQQLKADVMLAKGIADASLKPLKDELEAARREAREAKEEAKRVREGKTTERIKQEFFEKNLALRSHNKEVDEFLNSYPDAEEVSVDTLKKRLELASKYIKGTVKENMRTNKPSETGSSRMEYNDDRESDEIGEFDPKGTGNAGAAQLMAQVHQNFGKSGLRREDSVEVWKKCLDDEGRGVSIGMDEDLERYRAFQDRDVIGGKRG